MKKEDLLKPRYKVIGDFPHSSMPVGMVFYKEDKDGNFWDLYPHLFRKLEWWEERKVEDMPEYVKLFFNDRVHYIHKVERWAGENSYGHPLYEYYNKVNYLMTGSVSGLLPATLEEYTTYLTTLSPTIVQNKN